MCLREEGDSPFIGENDGANPTSNQCGIALFFKNQQISTLKNMRIPSRNFSLTKAATPPNALNDAIKLLQC